MRKKNLMKRLVAITLLSVLGVSQLTGCVVNTAEESGETSEAEELDESVLNIYTALEDDQLEEYLTTFREEYPDVELNITRDSTGIIAAKLLAEKDNPQADVVWGLSAASLLILESEGMLEPYAPEGVERILPEFKDDAEVPLWVGIDAWETAFLVNKEVLASAGVTDIPQSYEDLLDPQYQGLIAMSNPASSGTGTLTVNGVLTLMGEDEGWEYLDALHENVEVYLHSGSAPAKDTAKGEYGIGISYGYRCIKSGEEMGDNGVVVFPEEGSGWDLEANCLIKKEGGEKEVAKDFLDWAITDDMMEKYRVNYPIVATGADGIPEGYEVDPVSQLIPEVDLVWCAENRDRILEEWTTRYDGKSDAE